jgi:hypothetical protein
MAGFLLLYETPRPHTGLRTRDAVAKMVRTVLPRPAHSPDLAPCDCHLFGPAKDVLRGRHFGADSEMKQSFRDVLPSRGREFYNSATQRRTEGWQKCVESDGDFVEKQPHNWKTCMNHPGKYHSYLHQYIVHPALSPCHMQQSFEYLLKLYNN